MYVRLCVVHVSIIGSIVPRGPQAQKPLVSPTTINKVVSFLQLHMFEVENYDDLEIMIKRYSYLVSRKPSSIKIKSYLIGISPQDLNSKTLFYILWKYSFTIPSFSSLGATRI